MSALTVPMSDRTRVAQDKARVLQEALPWMTRWSGRTLVVKYGGNALSAKAQPDASHKPQAWGQRPREEPADLQVEGDDRGGAAAIGQGQVDHPGEDPSFAADIALLRSVGVRVVVVHGGGPQISALSDRLGLATQFVDGKRVTDTATLQAVQMALLGQINPMLVRMISEAGSPAVGVSGTDSG
ncbi:MAG TPA: hypothetical protein VMM13_07130, partial [Euzebya sp.]|nr:hypothetical protein [Euzebya sp.]